MMGFKIYKAIGYGAEFPEGTYHNLSDTVFEDSVKGEVDKLIVDYVNSQAKGTRNPFDHTFLETKTSADMCRCEYPETYSGCVLYTAFIDRKQAPIILMPPLYAKTWYRWDDAIDYYEASDTDDHIKVIDRPINPYNFWMDANTGENIISDYDYSGSQCMNNMVPGIPFSVKLIADKLGLDWKILRPMAATWWS